MLDASVAEVISKLVINPKFSDLIRSKINMEVDTSALDQEIANFEKQLRLLYRKAVQRCGNCTHTAGKYSLKVNIQKGHRIFYGDPFAKTCANRLTFPYYLFLLVSI